MGAGGQRDPPGSRKPVAEFTLPAPSRRYRKPRSTRGPTATSSAVSWTIGDRVVAGQVLAEIDTPELDQQLSKPGHAGSGAGCPGQALANLEQGRSALVHNQAQLGYNGTNLSAGARSRSGSSWPSRTSTTARCSSPPPRPTSRRPSQRRCAGGERGGRRCERGVQPGQCPAATRDAIIPEDPCALRRIITVRNVDNGALISSGSATSNTSVYRMAQIDSLRIFVSVPQDVCDGRQARPHRRPRGP